jgi:HSP20 family molecular chaperone IbpA
MFDEKIYDDLYKIFEGLDGVDFDTGNDFWSRIKTTTGTNETKVGKSESTIVNEETFTTITTDLPGYKKEGIKVSTTAKILTVVVEGTRGKKTYNYKLTETADFQKISSRFEDGVLTLTVPKKTEALPVEIKVD